MHRAPRSASRVGRVGRITAVVGATLLMVSGALTFGQATAGANQSNPAINPDCGDRNFAHELKVDTGDPDSEPYVYDDKGTEDTADDETITISDLKQLDGENFSFDWASQNILVELVMVKAGSLGPEEYAYPGGATSGDDLTTAINPKSSKNYGISHISFCWGEGEDDPEPGSFTVDKRWFDDGGTELTEWPEGLSVEVTIDLSGDEESIVVTLDEENPSKTVEIPAGVTVTGVSEGAIDDYTEMGECAVSEDSDYTFCNQEDEDDTNTTTTRRRNRSSTTTVDMCTNIAGNQATIPDGLVFGPGGVCTELEPEVLALTPEPEVEPEVLPTVLEAPAPQLPFTGDGTGRLALVAVALLAIGSTLVLGARRQTAEVTVD
jgi:hypothetical protein